MKLQDENNNYSTNSLAAATSGTYFCILGSLTTMIRYKLMLWSFGRCELYITEAC